MIQVIASFLLPAVAFLGVWLQGNKSRTGWLVNGGAQIFWFCFGLFTHQWGFAFSAPVFFLLNVRGWIKWRPSQPGHCDTCHQRLPKEVTVS